MSNQLSFDVNLVPKEWLTIPCGVFFFVISIKNTEGEINLSGYRDYGVIPKDSRDDNHNRVSEDTSNYKLVEPGDFVLNKMKGWSGSLGVSDYRGIVSPSYTVLEPVREIHNKYFHYLLRSETYRQMYESLSYGVRIGQWELRYDDFKQIPSPYPPIEEQKLISRYLDKKTIQIDSLVEEIKKKIDLLKEQRITLISKVVTKGLNPNIGMKNSGIKWIGEVPRHWEIKKLKYLVKHIKEKNTPAEEDIKISPEYVESDTGICFNQHSEHTGNGYKFIHGDILLNKLRIYLKKFLLVDFEGYSIGEMIVLRTEQKSHSEFIFNCLFSDDLIRYLNSLSTGVKVPRVSPDEILSTKFPLPPTEEITKINEFIKHNNVEIFNQISIEERRIKLLKEYKRSLVFEVVTGKKRVVS